MVYSEHILDINLSYVDDKSENLGVYVVFTSRISGSVKITVVYS